MLRKFKINVDGKEYQVEMEEEGVQQNISPIQSAPVPQPDATAQEIPKEQPAPPISASEKVEGEAMGAPMPGTILKILVNVGDAVTENQPLMILEAMKMENEVVANLAGTVKSIHVNQGDMVNPGEPLVTIS